MYFQISHKISSFVYFLFIRKNLSLHQRVQLYHERLKAMNMEKKEYPCEQCKMRQKYEQNPKSFVARFWHWHTGFCPGWKGYFRSLNEQEQAELRIKYNLKPARKG
jgi:hypothetical protein